MDNFDAVLRGFVAGLVLTTGVSILLPYSGFIPNRLENMGTVEDQNIEVLRAPRIGPDFLFIRDLSDTTNTDYISFSDYLEAIPDKYDEKIAELRVEQYVSQNKK
jgi:hypothetical protein